MCCLYSSELVGARKSLTLANEAIAHNLVKCHYQCHHVTYCTAINKNCPINHQLVSYCCYCCHCTLDHLFP